MIPEMEHFINDIEQIIELSRGWFAEHGRHAVVLSGTGPDRSCTPMPLSFIRIDARLSDPILERTLESYDPHLQVIVFGNDSKEYQAMTILEGESLRRAQRPGGWRWFRKLSQV